MDSLIYARETGMVGTAVGRSLPGDHLTVDDGLVVLSAVAAAGGYTYRADQNFIIITRNGEDYRADLMTSIQPDDIIRAYDRWLS